MAEIVADADRDHSPVYALAFHVDYWDYLGWKDSFSDAQYSERQRWYASRAPESGVYTPELVVGGTESFVGSDRRRARSAVRRAIEASWPAAVSLSSDAQGRISYRVDGGPRPAHLNLALIQPHAHSQVAAGENSGTTLNHVNVVREFERVALTPDANGSWAPRSAAGGALRAVAYVQDDRTLAVVGAAAVAASCIDERRP